VPFARVDVAEDVAAVRWVRAELQRGAVFTNRVDTPSTHSSDDKWRRYAGRRLMCCPTCSADAKSAVDLVVRSTTASGARSRGCALLCRALESAAENLRAHRTAERSAQRSSRHVRCALSSARWSGSASHERALDRARRPAFVTAPMSGHDSVGNPATERVHDRAHRAPEIAFDMGARE